MVKIKRVYERAEGGDGERILVDRLWPRGLSKRAAAVDDQYPALPGALDGFLDAGVVLETADGAHDAVHRSNATVGLEDRLADLQSIRVCVAQVGRGPIDFHHRVSGAQTR